MDRFLQIVGMAGVALILLVLVILIFSTRGGMDAGLALAAALPWAFPAIVGCVIIAAFGNMLGQLKAIRAASERQVDMFQSIMDSRKASPPSN